MSIEILRAAQRAFCLTAWVCLAGAGQTQVLEPVIDGKSEGDHRSADGLLSHTYQVEPALLLAGAEAVGARATQERVRVFLERHGIVLQSEEGESFFYNDRTGELRIRAGARQIALLEEALEVTRSTLPVVEIRTAIVEFTEATLGQELEALFTSEDGFPFWKNREPGVLKILTEAEASTALKQLELTPGVDLLRLPAAEAASGRVIRLALEEKEPVFMPPFHAPRKTPRWEE